MKNQSESIYWLISEDCQKTYIGHSADLDGRIKQHQMGQVSYTKNFGRFKCFVLESNLETRKARQREIYWKSACGRKKLKNYFKKIITSDL